MATLVFSAVGTALGGPLGGALGALMGNQLDRAVIGSPSRQGPRLKELAITTSSYGTAVARHFGTVRAPGTVMWATDLKETREKSSGSKGSPSITTFAYSISFAVALASRPLRRVGRIWADGNLLRGTAGDLKVGGQFRFYNGFGDQEPDQLIASDRGSSCPAFRGLSYCVFEDLLLADFGNRIPGLTFELVADDGAISLTHVADGLGQKVAAQGPLPQLIGFSDEGGPLASSLAAIDQLYPMTCQGSSDVIRLNPADLKPSSMRLLPEPAIDEGEDGFGGLFGKLNRRQNDMREIPEGIRYYDVDRDYQAGMQRSVGRAREGRSQALEFPGVLSAGKARQLCNAMVQRASWSSDQLSWRIAEIDPALAPGQVVSVPGRPGAWLIESWEWRVSGIELDLRRLPPGGPSRSPPADAGEILKPKDALASPTILLAFELPWDGNGAGNERLIYAAASSRTDGWTGAALYAVDENALSYIMPTGQQRSVVGSLVGPLAPSDAILLDRASSIEVELASDSFVLEGTTASGLAAGENRVLVGGEILQFATVQSQGSGKWRLGGLLRGRGGTEAAASKDHDPGTQVILLDSTPVRLDTGAVAVENAREIAAIGLADDSPVVSRISNPGLSLKPLTPVHPRLLKSPNGSWHVSWAPRSRGAWKWSDGGEGPLRDANASYIVGVGQTVAPAIYWQSTQPRLELAPETVASLRAEHRGTSMWVKQIEAGGASDPLLLCSID